MSRLPASDRRAFAREMRRRWPHTLLGVPVDVRVVVRLDEGGEVCVYDSSSASEAGLRALSRAMARARRMIGADR